MGNLFYRQQPIDNIYALTYHEMKYWNEWHEIMIAEEKKAIEKAKSKGKR